MQFLSKHRGTIVSLILIGFAYSVLRLLFFTKLPIFTDEAIYVRWAQIAVNDANWRFISLTDGKQPSFIWVAMVFMKLIDDPIVATRLVSVVTGFVTLAGLWILTWELFKNKYIATLAALLYVCFPFAQVYDRLALYDSMVSALYIWALYFSILLVRHLRLDIAYTLGFAIGIGILTKSTNFFSIYLLPCTLLLFDWKKTQKRKRLLRWVLLAGFAVVIAQVLYSVLRLSPFYTMVVMKNATFVYPFGEWIQHPFLHLVSNAKGLISWLIAYLKPTYIVLIFAGWYYLRQYQKEKLLMLAYFLVPFAALIVFGRIIFPRFIFFMSLPLLTIASVGLYGLMQQVASFSKKKFGFSFVIARVLVVVFFVGYSAFVSLHFAVDPVHAAIADADSNQYVNNWTAGWGVKESISFFQKEAQDKKIAVATEGTFGLLPASLELYLVENKNILLKGYWPLGDEGLPKEVLENATKMPTYMIFYQPEHVKIPSTYPLELVFQKQQGKSFYYLRLYKVVAK